MERMDITIEGQNGRKSRIAFGPLALVGEGLDPRRCVIVTDGLVRRVHGSAFPPCPVVEVERGEAAKSLASLERLYGDFLDRGLGRDGLVLAVGGGAVSDLAGFAASTWLRGVDFGFVPSTLLSMVDASVGGKNGIDFRGKKNLVGSFSQPGFVRIDVGLLSSLGDLEFASGMAEVIKHAVLSGEEYFSLLERGAGRGRPEAEELELIVALSVELKAAVVGRDEREAGERRKLNLGHTVGHGIEAVTGLPHGHSVAAGLGTACRLARDLGRLAPADCDRITRLLGAWGLPASIGEAAAMALETGRIAEGDGAGLRASIADAAMVDKKRSGDALLMALPEALGSVLIQAVGLDELRAFVMEAP